MNLNSTLTARLSFPCNRMTGWAYHINSLVVSCYRRQHKLRRAISSVYSDQVFIFYFFKRESDQVNCKQRRSQTFEL